MTAEEAIKDIRKRCRLAMDGITSTNMREYGLNYKLNFGVSLPKIKEIAQRYQPDKELAETLWKEDVRELKILATLLYPADEFDKQDAGRWVVDIPNQEIREQICINLLQQLPFAGELSLEWGNSNTEDIRATGYWLMARLLITQKAKDIRTDSYPYIFTDLESENISLRNAALLFLKQTGRNSASQAGLILDKISHMKTADDNKLNEIYNSLEFEFDYYS